MNSFEAKPGETIVGLGVDFATRLSAGEMLVSVTLEAEDGLTIVATSVVNTVANATIAVAVEQLDADLSITYTATGSAGSILKFSRRISVRALSE